MKYLDLMEKEIRNAGRAITIREALTMAEQDGTIGQLESVGKTPEKTINSLLHKDIEKGDRARFVQESQRPATFNMR